MELPHEKSVSSNVMFSGRIVNVRRDEVVFPNGSRSWREVVEHPGGVGILPVDKDGNAYLVRQFRYVVGREIFEIPAGKLEIGEIEHHRDAAARELREETGFTAGRLEFLGQMYPSPGVYGEILYIYLARDLIKGETDFDEGEYLEPVKIPMETLRRMIRSNEIRDAKTVFAYTLAKEHMREN